MEARALCVLLPLVWRPLQGVQVRVCLRDMWADQVVHPGDTVNVVGGRVLPSPTCTMLEVSATEGLLVLHPDVLLSGDPHPHDCTGCSLNP